MSVKKRTMSGPRYNSRGNQGAVVWCHVDSRQPIESVFDPAISNRIEANSLTNTPNSNSITRFPLDPNGSSQWVDYEIEFQTLTLVNKITGDLRQVRRYICGPESVFSQGYEWVVKGDLPRQWITYDFYSSQLIEDAFSNRNQHSFPLDLSITQAALPYIIDYKGKSYSQTNIYTKKKRNVKRQKLPFPYTSTPMSGPSAAGNLMSGAAQQAVSQQGSVVTTPPMKKQRVSKSRSNLQSSQPPPGYAPSNSSSSPTSLLTSIVSGIWNSASSVSKEVTEPLPRERRIQITRDKRAKDQKNDLNIDKYMTPVTDASEVEADCSICMERLTEDSGFGEGGDQAKHVVKLVNCQHTFHRLCLLAMYESGHKEDCLQCPSCKAIYGEKQGNCPPGEMIWEIRRDFKIPGYERYNVIRMVYTISPGIQGPGDPKPGSRYRAHGFPREGFLPDCDKGRKVLKLLIEAFKRKLMFTIGTSVTTGVTDTVVWNEIHLKTEPTSNHSGHGYPDPSYLDNVLMELANQGVREEIDNASL